MIKWKEHYKRQLSPKAYFNHHHLTQVGSAIPILQTRELREWDGIQEGPIPIRPMRSEGGGQQVEIGTQEGVE